MQGGKFIYLAGFSVEKRLVLAVAKNIKEVFGFDVRFSHIAMPPWRGNFYTVKWLLDYMSKVYYPDMLKLLLILPFNISVGEEEQEVGNAGNIVLRRNIFGFGEIGGRYAAVSTYMLQSREEGTFFERVIKEVNHELGHTFGLQHCRDQRCIMSFSRSVQELDAKSRFFCEFCSKILPKP